ncbi:MULTISPECIES: ester cyclase [unclassified Diaminobutyricimonas]|uniref:ester cyclase n=1 Tax=unclassified Diaminobutyricimonas TaxID=2643261 RepID=UPI0012F4B0EE|nr:MULTISPECIES: ester cyclase [unclassified Diaminobutyricimonas]
MNGKDNFAKTASAFNDRDVAAFTALYAADAVVSDPFSPEPLRGRDAIAQDMADVLRAMSDARFTVGRMLEEGDLVVGEFTVAGTHDGPFATATGEIAPTGNPVRLEGAVFSRLNAMGEVIEERRYYDVASVLHQLGAAA